MMVRFYTDIVDAGIQHTKVTFSTRPVQENEDELSQSTHRFPYQLDRSEATQRCATQAKKDTEFIMHQKKVREQLYDNFDEYIKERLKVERENARTLEAVTAADITTRQDVEDRLCYVEQFIDVVSADQVNLDKLKLREFL